MPNKINLLSIFILIITISACTPPVPAPTQTYLIPTLPPNINIPAQVACTTLPIEPTPGPGTPSLFPPVTSGDHVRGTDKALVSIMVYSDFQDPRSAAFAEVTKQLLEEFPGSIFMINRPFPVFVINDKSTYAALAAEAAAEQGKYWEMHDRLFERQAEWINLSVDDFKSWIVDQLPALELNVEQFKTDYSREDIIARIQKAWEDGTSIQLPGTPVVVLNGEIYQGSRDYPSLRDIIQLILLGKRQFSACPPVTVDMAKEYTATLHTEKGEIVIQLFADKAPYTVNSFLFLVQNGWYNDITFHRVITNLYAQTGDPSGTGKGNPGYYVVTEIIPTLTFNTPGLVAMVNSGPDTSGSQFFITLAPIAEYNGKYTIFGQVLKGLEVVQALTPRNAQPGSDTPPGDKLLSIEINEP